MSPQELRVVQALGAVFSKTPNQIILDAVEAYNKAIVGTPEYLGALAAHQQAEADRIAHQQEIDAAIDEAPNVARIRPRPDQQA